MVVAGLKKETKKLTKALKAHRKRLEALLHRQDAVGAMQPIAAAAAPAPALSHADLHAVLAELAHLQTSLAAVRQQRLRMATCNEDSSDSDSDCEDEPAVGRMPQMQQVQLQMQPQCVATQQQEVRAPRQQVVASSSVCVQPAPAAAAAAAPITQPVVQDDICQQLPPPKPYTTTGRVLVCQGKACVRKGGLQVLQAVSHATSASTGVEVLPCKCLGKCKQAPAMRVRGEGQPQSMLFTQVGPLEVPEVLDQLLQ